MSCHANATTHAGTLPCDFVVLPALSQAVESPMLTLGDTPKHNMLVDDYGYVLQDQPN